ncbi:MULTISPECIES: hypothetical protein [Flavobacterium]|jgi:hypothetical protein|uniref:Bacteriocin n=1 Tax=Flavobacterium cupriresistens TaxID=2893885 RepID=A0ABU4RHW2_9FLAO|nr:MULTISPECIES: hypothetical protein [unclassified Flavobacterium]MDX6192140.1 hypothetical protein [Flavobacterium sp. Fl-318]UFH43725.1 hypothetical protein LNP23_05770 [Flavobacterium sp. F-323]
MKKFNLKKLALKKTSIIELSSEEARLIIGGNSTENVVPAPNQTDPRSMYSMFCG